MCVFICFFKQKTAYEMRISDWSSDVCSSDLAELLVEQYLPAVRQWGFVDQLASGYLVRARLAAMRGDVASALSGLREAHLVAIECGLNRLRAFVVAEQVRILVKSGQIEEADRAFLAGDPQVDGRSEEHTSELQSLMR